MVILLQRNLKNIFKCNHLNGYSYETNEGLHTINSLKDFDYLNHIPKFLFSNHIALEMFNSIDEQLKYKKYLIKKLNKKFKTKTKKTNSKNTNCKI